MFNPSRDEVRRFFFEAWGKYRRGETLQGLEQTAVEVMLLHPEYHAVLAKPDENLERDYRPEGGELNPFLHLSLHLAIEEQLSIDRPPGRRAAYERLLARLGSVHAAKHAVLECLGETMWESQRLGRPPDENAYVECVARKAGG